MGNWLKSILTVSVAMTLLLRMLPENSVKKTVHIAFGIIFLLVVTVPCTDMLSNGADIDKISSFFASKISASDTGSGDKYVETVISEYSEILCEQAKNKIYEETGFRCELKVSVCGETDSAMFGKVLNAECNVITDDSDLQSENAENIVTDIPLVKDIVIAFSKKDGESKIDTNGITSVLTELFGINPDQCEIYIS